MHGIVLMELKKHVEQAYGAPTWTALLLAADLQGRMYTPMGEYPDAEVLAIVAAASKATGKPVDEVVEGFGRFLVPDLVETYHFLVQSSWDALDLIEHTEQTIHTVVRARDGGTPPVLEVTRTSPDSVTIRYSSTRMLCSLAKGIARGVGDLYGTPLEVQETTCMKRGAGACTLSVIRIPAPVAPRRAEDDLVRDRRW